MSKSLSATYDLKNLKNISSQPFIHAVKVDQTGEADYDKSIVFSVRGGSSLLFLIVSLTQGLASVIQLCFAFNLMYP